MGRTAVIVAADFVVGFGADCWGQHSGTVQGFLLTAWIVAFDFGIICFYLF